MNESTYEILNDLLMEMQQEDNDLQRQIDHCLIKMKEEYTKANAVTEEIQFLLKQSYVKQEKLRSKIDKLQKIMENNYSFHDDTNLLKKNLRILNIQEEDRQRIARDLHDTSLQNLAHLVHKIELSGMYIDQDPIRAKLELAVISKNLKSVIDEIRNTIFDLRPMTFDDLGLKPAFEQLFAKINIDNTYEIESDIDNVSCENDLILATVFRVVQECLINVKKHAEANKIFFTCQCVGDICVIDISDNGKGFSKEEVEGKQNRHFGLNVMKERISLLGGKISIDSEKEKGTQIHLEVPLS